MTTTTRPLSTILLENVVNVFTLLNVVILGVLAGAYVHYNDVRLLYDCIGIALVVVINMTISIVRDVRTHRLLERMNVDTDSRARVERPSGFIDVAVTDISENDVLLVAEGDILPADGEVLESRSFQLNAAILTGESADVQPTVGESVYAGTICTMGSARIRVTRLGSDTAAAHIVASARRYDFSPSPTQRRVNRLFELWFGVAILITVLEFALRPEILTNIDDVRRVFTALIGLIPEGLVFFSTLAMVGGVIRIAASGVRVAKLSSLESIASATAVCFDKTGTITTGTSVVRNVLDGKGQKGQPHDAVQNVDTLLDDAIRYHLDRAPTFTDVDEALRRHVGITSHAALPAYDNDTVVPFSSERRWSASRLADSTTWFVIGAPDVFQCHDVADQLHGRVVACALLFSHPLHTSLNTIEPLRYYEFGEELRDGISTALEAYDRMGVSLHVISGDSQDSVSNVVSRLNHASITIHGGCTPRDKERIIEDLQHEGHHVVMIGDGVNDVPAIKRADVGVGLLGAPDVVIGSSDIVIPHNGFLSIPNVITEGRRTTRTILFVASLYIAKNVMILFMSILGALGVYMPLSPRRGALLSVVCVTIPVLAATVFGLPATPVRNFLQHVIRYSTVASSLSVISVLVSTSYFPHTTSPMVIIAVILGSMCGSAIFAERDTILRRKLAGTGFVVYVGFVGVLLCNGFPGIDLISGFYELTPITPSTTLPVMLGLLIPTVAAAGVHRLADHWIFSQRD